MKTLSLSGEYSYKIDKKGRVSLPAPFRDAFADGLVVTRGMDKCVAVYSALEWPRIENSLRELPLTDPRARLVQRRLVSAAVSPEVDKAGRIMIPQALRTYAALKQEVVLIGMINKVEVWDKDLWAAYLASADDDFEDFVKDFPGLVL